MTCHPSIIDPLPSTYPGIRSCGGVATSVEIPRLHRSTSPKEENDQTGPDVCLNYGHETGRGQTRNEEESRRE